MIKEINEEMVCEIINSKLLEWKDSSNIGSIQFKKVEYFKRNNSNEWEVISEWYHRIPINKFDEIMEANIIYESHINCCIDTILNMRSEIKINSNEIYIEFNNEGHKVIFRVKSFEKKIK